MIKILKVTNTLADLFWDEGWENHSRIKILKPVRKVIYLNTKVPSHVRSATEQYLFSKEPA